MTSPTWLTEIEERVKAATPGPWIGVDEEKRGHLFQFVKSATATIKNNRGPDYARVILEDGEYDTKSADVALVAHAPTDLTRLIADNRRLREALEPFAKSYDPLVMDASDEEGALVYPISIDEDLVLDATVGDLRRARTALTQDD